MTATATTTNSPSRRHRWAVVTALVLMLAGSGVLLALPHMSRTMLEKLPASLRKPLATIPREIGPYRGAEKDRLMEPEIVQSLGTPDYLLRPYLDNRKSPTEAGAMLFLNVNFYAKGDATPHVPDVCWKGAGRIRQADRVIVVRNVRHADGSVSDVPLRLLSFMDNRAGSDSAAPGEERYLNVAYVFQVNDQYVPNPAQVTRMFWRRESPYGYHTKIEITVDQPCTPERAQEAIADFVRESLASIETCLPSWKELNGQKPAADTAGVTAASK